MVLLKQLIVLLIKSHVAAALAGPPRTAPLAALAATAAIAATTAAIFLSFVNCGCNCRHGAHVC